MPLLGVVLLLWALPVYNHGPTTAIALDEKRSYWKTQFLCVLLYSLGACWSAYYWIPYTLKEFGEIGPPFNILMASGLSFVLFPYYFIFLPLLFLINKLEKKQKKSLPQKNILLALILCTLEYYTPQQFPAHLAHPWLSLSPYLGLAPVFGAPVFSFFSYWMALSIVQKLKTKKGDRLGFFCFALFVLFNFSLPLSPPRQQEGNLTKIRMVQANIGNLLKLSGEQGMKEHFREILKRHHDLSLRPQQQVDLIIWPETAFPKLLSSRLMKREPEYIPPTILSTIALSKAQLITGGYDYADKSNPYFFETEYNAIFFFNRGGLLKDVYRKQILMPFGESLPFGKANFLIAKVMKNLSFFARGTRLPLFELDNGATLINAICYEILFGPYIRNYLNHTLKTQKKNAHFIVNLTNDSWYGKTSEPYQHQYLSHWRALEFQIPIVRMTNTGLSSILYPDGSQSEDMGLFRAASKDYSLFTSSRPPTLFQKYGFYLTWTLGLGLFFISCLISLLISTLRGRKTLLK